MNQTLQRNHIYWGDALRVLRTFPCRSIDMVMTSPPYWGLRDYGMPCQLGREATVTDYVARLCTVFDEIRRILKDSGTCWVNLGDSYFHNRHQQQTAEPLKCKTVSHSSRTRQIITPKSLALVPYRFSLAMIDRGWILRNVIVWHKPNAMPQSAKDRFTVDFEYLFFFTKQGSYWFAQQFEPYTAPLNRWGGDTLRATGESSWDPGTGHTAYRRRPMRPDRRGRNKRCVWSHSTKPFPGTHFAVYPEDLCMTPILAGCPPGGLVLDPFLGAGTTAVVARRLGRDYVGIELNPNYITIARRRLDRNTSTEERKEQRLPGSAG